MSQRADIDQDFADAIEQNPALKIELLKLKLSVYESLDWDSAAYDTADEVVAAGGEVYAYQLRDAK